MRCSLQVEGQRRSAGKQRSRSEEVEEGGKDQEKQELTLGGERERWERRKRG